MRLSLSILILISIVALAKDLTSKPSATCTNIKSYQAYKMAKAIKGKCDVYNIIMSISDLHKTFLPMMTDEFALPERCNMECRNSSQNQKDCVEKRTTKWVEEAVNSGIYNKVNCLDMKSRIK